LLWLLRSEHDEKAQAAKVIELLGSFIFQEAGDRPFSSDLIHFFAVLGIDKETDRLRSSAGATKRSLSRTNPVLSLASFLGG
jgi:hypothetical protein